MGIDICLKLWLLSIMQNTSMDCRVYLALLGVEKYVHKVLGFFFQLIVEGAFEPFIELMTIAKQFLKKVWIPLSFPLG